MSWPSAAICRASSASGFRRSSQASVSSAWLGSSGTLEPAMMARIRAFATSRGVTADHQAADHLGVHDDGNDKKRRQRLIEKRPDAQDQDAQVPSEPHGVLQTL